MEHERIQAELSARLDGEEPGLDDDVLEAHLAGCADCRRFYAEARRLGEELGPDAVPGGAPGAGAPDLTDTILASVETEWRRHRTSRLAALAVSRLLLVVLAGCYVIWGVALLSDTSGLLRTGAASGLLAPDAEPRLADLLVQGAAMRLALAIALLFCAWRPRIGIGLLPFVGGYGMFSLGFAMRDVVLGTAGAVQLTGLTLLIVTVVAMGWAFLTAQGPAALRSTWLSLGAGPQGR